MGVGKAVCLGMDGTISVMVSVGRNSKEPWRSKENMQEISRFVKYIVGMCSSEIEK